MSWIWLIFGSIFCTRNANSYTNFVPSPSCDLVGRIPAIEPGGPGSIPGGVRDFNFYPGTGCVSFAFCPVLSGGGPDILLTTDSGRPALLYISRVLVQSLWITYISYTLSTDIWILSPGGVIPTLEESKTKKERKEKCISSGDNCPEFESTVG